MRRKDLAEMRRRLEEIMFIAERGYEPVDLGPGEEPGWVKCHMGTTFTHAGALEEIARDSEDSEASRAA
jgi:hypothetical protein